MSLNVYQPHILILPEDDANRQIANGFINNLNVNDRVIQILPNANGWGKVVEKFKKDHVLEMRQFPDRRMILLIDFDKNENRLSHIQKEIPPDIMNRVFVLGVQSNPEALRRTTKQTLETIGDTLAQDCLDRRNQLWKHELLQHNEAELDRMDSLIKSSLFNH